MNNIKKIADSKGKKYNWIAAQVDVHYATFIRWVNNEYQPSINHLKDLAEALECSVDEIIN